MKMLKHLPRHYIVLPLITALLLVSGCEEDEFELEVGDTLCPATYNALFDFYIDSSAHGAFGQLITKPSEVPCRWLDSGTVPIPTQTYNIEGDRFDIGMMAYSGKSVGSSINGLWLVIESRSENPYYKPSQPEHSIFNRYTCEFSLNASGELMSSNLCPLTSEAKAPIIFDSDTQTLKSVWEEVENKDTKNEVTVTYTLDTSLVEAGILTGSLTNIITEDPYWKLFISVRHHLIPYTFSWYA